jgi:DNA gyrase, A subunit
MTPAAKEILPVNLEEEMKKSYLDYAMSVIIGRALPDVRDGLKPVHRRVLYAMSQLGNDWNKPYKKSARVVGDVIGKYHPHGETAVYDTIVRMAQPFSMRYMLVDGQGNFGSVDGDAPAAMRYTEVRMAHIAHELLADIDKEAVDFELNYDETERIPAVLPTRIPNLLMNGATGIAVGMATNIPPHNVTEIVNACVALSDNPNLAVDQLMELLPGPDFPTGAIISGEQGIREAYRTGRGRLYVRARTHVEDTESVVGKQAIVATELPYQVNKARLLEKIAELVKEKKLEGIAELRDESDKEGMRVVIELKRGEIADVVLNNLYRHTHLQTVFGINMVGLVDGQPRLLNLKDILETFLRHRREVVTRRTLYDLRKARERAHVLEGLAVALANIDEVIVLIKASTSRAEARTALLERHWPPGALPEMLARSGASISQPEDLPPGVGLSAAGYRLSESQANAILDLRLHQLTGLEQDKIINEYKLLIERIEDLLDILCNPDRLMRVIRDELIEMREQFGDARRTEIVPDHQDLTREDLIGEEDVVVTLSHAGYAKTQPLDSYTAQHRGGKGKAAASVKDEDFIDKLFLANTHDTLLCFSSRGKAYWLKVYDIPQAGRTSRGRPIVNLLPLEEDERITAVLPVRDFTAEVYVFMATARGTVKKTLLGEFSRPRTNGIIALELRDDDRLVGVALTDGARDVMLFSNAGKVIRFREEDIRAVGRVAAGVRGMRLGEGQRMIALLIVEDAPVLTATQHGYGKCTPIEDYPLRSRGGSGVISIQTTPRNGEVVGALQVSGNDEIMLISQLGALVRIPAAEIPVSGRNTQGVKLISLDAGDQLVGLEKVESLKE